MVETLGASAGDVRDAGSISGLGRFPWRRKWQPTTLFVPGKFQTEEPGDYSPWGYKESDMTEVT